MVGVYAPRNKQLKKMGITTRRAAQAFMEAKPFKSANTNVIVKPNVTIMTLFGNEIAYRYNDPERTLSITNCGWSTRVTNERLNGILQALKTGVNLRLSKNKVYLNDVQWNGILTDIK